MKLPSQAPSAVRNGGCHALHICKSKSDRLLTILWFLLSADGDAECPVVLADAGMVALVDAILRYSGGAQAETRLYPVAVEELAQPGEILRAEPFLAAVQRAISAARRRCPLLRLLLHGRRGGARSELCITLSSGNTLGVKIRPVELIGAPIGHLLQLHAV
ncbi:MAG: hypothetical protein EA384_10910 [Spirochaetaceae bacterium]|nr:MAG: hypothetical protein EA384_10910 [Spirochaetaceae bacterium]